MAIDEGTSVQKGVGYISTAGRTFSSGAIVPMAETVEMVSGGSGEAYTNEEGAVDCYGTDNPMLVMRGDFKLKTGTDCPSIGDVLDDNSSPARKFVVSSQPVYKNFNPTTGKPMIVTMELTYWPAVHTGEGGS